jgi:hypothetical protein
VSRKRGVPKKKRDLVENYHYTWAWDCKSGGDVGSETTYLHLKAEGYSIL